jgi:hypothetical protein
MASCVLEPMCCSPQALMGSSLCSNHVTLLLWFTTDKIIHRGDFDPGMFQAIREATRRALERLTGKKLAEYENPDDPASMEVRHMLYTIDYRSK